MSSIISQALSNKFMLQMDCTTSAPTEDPTVKIREIKMFVDVLSEKQQAILLQLVHKIAEADGVLHDNEKKIINLLKTQMSPQREETKSDDLKNEFRSMQSKVALLLELVGVAFADSDYQQKEQRIIASIANEIGIEHEKLSKIENWVLKQFSLVNEAYQMMEE